MKIYDGHIHIIEDTTLFGRDMTFTWKDLEAYMGKVDRVQLMTAMENDWDSVAINRKFFERLERFPFRDRVWAVYWPHANEVDNTFLVDYDVASIKYHPSVSQLEVDKATDVLDLCEDSGLPLIVHCGRNIKSRIEFCINAYKERDITLIAAHLGGVSPPLVSRALQLLEKEKREGTNFDNFYLDTSSIDVSRLIARAINVMGSKNIIFGTDAPFHELDTLRYSLQQVWEREDVDITSQDMRNVLYQNLDRIHRRRTT